MPSILISALVLNTVNGQGSADAPPPTPKPSAGCSPPLVLALMMLAVLYVVLAPTHVSPTPTAGSRMSDLSRAMGQDLSRMSRTELIARKDLEEMAQDKIQSTDEFHGMVVEWHCLEGAWTFSILVDLGDANSLQGPNQESAAGLRCLDSSGLPSSP